MKKWNLIGANWILAGILLLSAALRLAGLGWGLPVDPYTGYYHPDEPKIVRAMADFPGHIWSNHDLRYPTLYPYMLAGLTYPLRDFIEQGPALFGASDDSKLGYYLVARLGVIIAGVLAVYGVYRLYKREDRAAGLLAAAFLGVAMLHVSNSAFATLDVPSSLMAVVAMGAAYGVVEQPTTRRYLALGVALGALAAIKYPAGLLAVSGVAAHWLAWRQRRVEESGWWWRAGLDYRLWLTGLTAVGVLVVATPGLVVHPESFQEGVLAEIGRVSDDPDSRLALATWSKAMSKLFTVVGLLLGVAVWIGAGRALWRPTYKQLLPLLFILSYYFVFVQNMRRRYFIVLLPFMCLLAAIWLVDLYRRRPQPAWRIATGGIIGVVLVSALLFTLGGLQTRLAPDPRYTAVQWLDRHAPAGSTVGFGYGGACDSGFDAPLYRTRFRVREGKSGPDYLVLDDCNFNKLEEAAPDSPEFRFYDDILNGTAELYRYELIDLIRPYKPVELDMGASKVYLYRSQWLAQQQFELPPEATRLEAAPWAGQIALAGYRSLECNRLSPGESFQLTLYWQARQTMAENYTVFVHIVDSRGNIVAQQDRQPLQEVRPTSRWVPGEVLADPFDLTIPAEAESGQYEVKVGWYDAVSGQRLATETGDSVTLPLRLVVGGQ